MSYIFWPSCSIVPLNRTFFCPSKASVAIEEETILLSVNNVTDIYLCLGYSMLAHSPVHSRNQCMFI